MLGVLGCSVLDAQRLMLNACFRCLLQHRFDARLDACFDTCIDTRFDALTLALML
jgi:hypothetical protein